MIIKILMDRASRHLPNSNDKNQSFCKYLTAKMRSEKTLKRFMLGNCQIVPKKWSKKYSAASKTQSKSSESILKKSTSCDRNQCSVFSIWKSRALSNQTDLVSREVEPLTKCHNSQIRQQISKLANWTLITLCSRIRQIHRTFSKNNLLNWQTNT